MLFIVWFGLFGVVCVAVLLIACFGYCGLEIVVGFACLGGLGLVCNLVFALSFCLFLLFVV